MPFLWFKKKGEKAIYPVRCTLVLLCILVPRYCLGQDLVDIRTSGFAVNVDKAGWIRVYYRGLSLVTGSNFTVSAPEWKGNFFPGKAAFKVERLDNKPVHTAILTATVKGIGEYKLTIEVSPEKVRIANDYALEPSPRTGWVYTECFLDKQLLEGAKYKDDAGNQGVLEIASGLGGPNKDLREVSLETAFGTLRIALDQEQTVGEKAGRVKWELRNVASRKWGPDDRKTFSIPNVYQVLQPAEIRGHSEYEIQFLLNETGKKELASRRVYLEKKRQEREGEHRAMLEKRRQRLAKRRGIVLVPEPQELQVMDGEFVISAHAEILTAADQSPEDSRPAARLAEELKQYYGVELSIHFSRTKGETSRPIVVGTPEGSPEVSRLLKERGLAVSVGELKPEGYILEVRPDLVLLAGKDTRGTWYGIQTLLQLLRWKEGRLVLPSVRIRDWPEFRTRAMMLTLGGKEQKGFLLHTLRRVLPRMKLNMVFIGGASLGRVRWPSHPEIASSTAFSAEDIRDLAEVARENFLEPVPHVQGFGHTGQLKNLHPDLVAPARTRQPCFDITRPESRKFIFEIYADAVEAFQPRNYFHVGFDEAQGLNEICKDQPASEVVANHITLVNQWLEKRGLQMVMWADMFLDRKKFGTSSAANSRAGTYGNVETAPALDQIPKSVILANWYYGAAEKHPQLEYLKAKGFQLFPTTWWLSSNNYNFIRSAHQAGLEWVAGSSWMYCSAMNPAMMNLLLGEYAWTPERPPLQELNYEPLGLLARWMKPPRPSDRPCRQVPIDIRSAMNRSYTDDAPGDDAGWLDLGSEQDLSALKPGRQRMARYLFDIAPAAKGTGCLLLRGPNSSLRKLPTTAVVPLDQTCQSLVFLHTLHYSEYGPRTVGAYVALYTDGKEERIPLRNAINTGPWLKNKKLGWWRRERIRGYYLETERAWTGYTLAGNEVDLLAFEWKNPRPEVPIKQVRLELTDRTPGLAAALFALTALGPAE